MPTCIYGNCFAKKIMRRKCLLWFTSVKILRKNAKYMTDYQSYLIINECNEFCRHLCQTLFDVASFEVECDWCTWPQCQPNWVSFAVSRKCQWSDGHSWSEVGQFFKLIRYIVGLFLCTRATRLESRALERLRDFQACMIPSATRNQLKF